jgi:four helix bundle protein
LEVFKLSEAISDAIWRVVADWGWFEKATIGKQITRAADSIGGNIAEGYGRYSFRENVQFCHYARGSLFETKYFVRRTYSRGILNEEQYASVIFTPFCRQGEKPVYS